MAQRPQPRLTSLEHRADMVRIGLVQTSPTLGAIDDNIAQIRDLSETLGRVDLAVTAELSATGYGFTPLSTADLLTADDPRLGSSSASPATVGIGFAQHNGSGKPWNSYLLTDPSTGSRHLQHKLHPVSYAPWNEHLIFQPGGGLQCAQVRGARIATIICNDMWHPSVPWLAVHRGAEILVVPVASLEEPDPARIRRTWQVLLEHAALVLQCYVVFVNRCGSDGGARFWGGSRILGPDGAVLASLDDKPGTAVADLDLAALRRLRAQVPLLAEYRADILAGIRDQPPTTTGAC